MPMPKSKTAIALLLVVSLIGAGVTLVEFRIGPGGTGDRNLINDLRAAAGDKPAAPSPDTKEPEKLKTLLKQRLEVAKESFDAHQKGALGEGVRVTEPPYATEEDGCHSSQTVSPSPAFLQRGLNLNPRRRT